MSPRFWQLTGWLAALAVLLFIFGLYQQPAFLVDMADRLWSCF
jgi:hypothetical protein